ncbi:MAG: TetR/AcrR family transcriptional regulator [Nocardioides sp.]
MTGSSAPSQAPSRDRLLEAAHDLLYRDGVGVGVEALCRAAKVSKRSMYQLFDSKEELIAASLDRAAPSYLSALMGADDQGPSPRERILHVFEYLEQSSCVADFRGCPFVATAVELKSPNHPASEVARRSEGALTDFFETQARRGGAPNPRLLAEQLTVVFDGASSHAVVQARPLNGVAVATATALLDQAGLSQVGPNATGADAP